ncbi:GNAT family N-acetyltransferase [Gymnodinialimonas sp. 2305UL16-5]|uniref:GNAT family N-acetyltransferase n=1 Tax=Gymnodinialimonas mytili TaxID=3126503 RepID=UPI0030AE716A
MVQVRAARRDDAQEMSVILADILESWGSDRPRSPGHVLSHYIAHPDLVKCSVAVGEDGEILGFQSLLKMQADNPYDVPAGWGVIGTYVAAKAARQGVGRKLFSSSLDAAIAAGLRDIDATIGGANDLALAYYGAMGFRTYRTKPGAVCKSFSVEPKGVLAV